MKRKLLVFSSAAALCFFLFSCGGKKENAPANDPGPSSQTSTAPAANVRPDWLSSSSGKLWTPDKGDAPFSKMTFYSDGTLQDAVSKSKWKINGNQLIVNIGFDISYTIAKVSDNSFSLETGKGKTFVYTAASADAGSPNDAQPVPSSSAPADAAPSFSKGDKVQVNWKGSWFPATILEVKADGKYRIHYTGYDSSWDETVSSSRIKK
ncbi:MAG TPA: Tudor-knot domain-containing protein [Bacteroidia bacterium]|nr:Tudor-knot domain-containing protein [Bacteroidia bacterium]